jgi:hypothetical protein
MAHTTFSLRPLAGGAAVALDLDGTATLGRGFAGIMDGKLSRQHCRLERLDGGRLAVEALGTNGIAIDGHPLCVLKPHSAPSKGFLRVGDVIWLLPSPKYPFLLESSMVAEEATCVDEPATSQLLTKRKADEAALAEEEQARQELVIRSKREADEQRAAARAARTARDTEAREQKKMAKFQELVNGGRFAA